MHILKIDFINVIARSHHLVLWSRLGDYQPRRLEDLLEEGALFNIGPAPRASCRSRSIRYTAICTRMGWEGVRTMAGRASRRRRRLCWITSGPHGETRASDFERTDGQKTGWFNWKEEKIVLEYLFYAGELMVRKRHNFQRIYDLRERVFADFDKLADNIARAGAHDQFVLNTMQALGVTKAEWLGNYFGLNKTDVKAALKRLAHRVAW